MAKTSAQSSGFSSSTIFSCSKPPSSSESSGISLTSTHFVSAIIGTAAALSYISFSVVSLPSKAWKLKSANVSSTVF